MVRCLKFEHSFISLQSNMLCSQHTIESCNLAVASCWAQNTFIQLQSATQSTDAKELTAVLNNQPTNIYITEGFDSAASR